MKCPFCSAELTKVIDSRPSEDNTAIRRRRHCENCGRRFTTYEKLEVFPIVVVKKDNTREPYDREKLQAGLLRACHKRPVTSKQISDLIDSVENSIFDQDVREIPTTRIGELMLERLKDIDQVAYIRFASVYREFTDVETFAEELRMLMNKEGDRQ